MAFVVAVAPRTELSFSFTAIPLCRPLVLLSVRCDTFDRRISSRWECLALFPGFSFASDVSPNTSARIWPKRTPLSLIIWSVSGCSIMFPTDRVGYAILASSMFLPFESVKLGHVLCLYCRHSRLWILCGSSSSTPHAALKSCLSVGQ